MHLVTPLSAGIKGAESGHAIIYRRGTSTKATWYTDFEGSSSSTSNVTLDANGGAEAYVNELITVNAYDSSGNLVRTFTAGVDSPVVEVKSQSFTGQNYTTAVQAAGEPTTLQSVLDKWKTSSGTIDFNVLVNGNKTKLSTFADLVTENIYNVQDSAYGAAGDGTTDDSSSIQSALNAANTAGGGTVYFPPGTYFIASGLTVAGEITMLGAGSSKSKILVDASEVTTGITLAASSNVELEGVHVYPDAVGASALVSAGGTSFSASKCVFGATSGTAGLLDCVDVTAGSAAFADCGFYLNLDTSSASSTFCVSLGSSTKGYFTQCRFDTVNAQNASVQTGMIQVADSAYAYATASEFSSTTVTSGSTSMQYIKNSAGAGVVLCAACAFLGNSSINSPIAVPGGSTSISRLASCRLASGVTLGSAVDNDIFAAGVRGHGYDSGNDTTETFDPSRYERFIYTKTGSTNATFDLSESYGEGEPGEKFTLVVFAGSSGFTLTPGSGWGEASSSYVLSANLVYVFEFIRSNSAVVWIEIGTVAGSDDT